ncbi:MAG TPA: ATP-binding protein [Gammaproteobacteria bacterium]|nr:ATP-binding protein [Gammaproteobacteria bacterium]
MSDMTDRVRIEERLVMLAAGIGTWRYQIASDCLRADDLARELLGLDREAGELKQADLLARAVPESVDPLRKFLTGEDAVTETDSIVFHRKRRDGSDRWLLMRARLLLARGGNGNEIVGIVMDDTEHQRLQQEVRDNEQWLQTLVSGVPQSFMYMDAEQRVVFANDIFRRNTSSLGYDVRGMHLSEIHGERLYRSRVHHIERALRGETVSYEAIGRKGDGMGFFHHEFKPNFDKDGKVIGIFATATDISDRRDIEQQLEAKQAELVRSNRDLEQFAYVASHDLKAPLRAIDVLVQWLREDLADYEGGDVQENLTLLTQRTQRLGRLLDDLLEYSRVGRKVGDIARIDANAMVKDLVELMSPPAGIEVEIAGRLPTFATYATPFEQVLRNLINNAIKHHPGPTGHIVVSCKENADYYVFSIADDGAGIPQEYAERVFQMFQTLKPRDEVEGSGMGLAIVSRIVEWQGGRVWFEPGPGGRGTDFKFQWKRKPVEQSAPEQIIEEPKCQLAEK